MDGDGEVERKYFELLATFPGVPVEKDVEETGREEDEVKACAFAENGNVLIGVGAREGIWIWRDRSGTPRNTSH